MTRFLVTDLETVPCLTTASRLWGIDPDAPDAYLQAAARRYAEGKDDRATDFMKPFMQRIVGIGMVGIDLSKRTIHVESAAGEDEAEYLRRFHIMLGGQPVLVGWNSLRFDLPVIRYRALFHQLPLPNVWGKPHAKGWEKYDGRYGDLHYDLMDLLACYDRSASLKLEEMAALLGLSSKTEGQGSEVLAFWIAGNSAQIRKKVEEDARDTARVFLRWWAGTGRVAWQDVEAMDEQLAATALAGVAA